MKTAQLLTRQLIRTVLALFFVLSVTLVSAQIQYQITESVDAGNPQGINTLRDDRANGWSLIISGPQSSNIWSTTQGLPFAFDVYGVPVTQFRVSQNGLLTFNTGTLGSPPNNNTSLPSASLPDLTLAVFWDSFTADPPTTNTSDVYSRTFGSSPYRQHWVKWSDFEYDGYSWAYFAVVLEETTNKVYFVDFNYNNGGPGSSTIGIQLDATTALQTGTSPNFSFTSGNRNPDDNDYYEFIPAGAPVSLPFSEDFSSCTWPAGWNQTSQGCSYRWIVSNSNEAGGTACEMRAEDQPGTGTGSSVLFLQPITTTGVTQLQVDFLHYFDDQGSGMTFGLASSSDFSSWTTEISFASGNGDIGPEPVSTVITNNLGATTYLAFFLNGNMNNDFNEWDIDNIVVQEYQPCLSIPYTQDFDAGPSWPSGWGTNNPDVWSISTNWPGASPPTGYHVFSDYTPYETGLVISPCFNGSGNNNLHVRFYHYWRANYPTGTQDGYFIGSPDGGTTVIVIDEWHHNAPALEEGWKEYDISSWADGAGNILFGWQVSHNDDWYWVFDDFQIQEGPWGAPGVWTGLVNTDWSNIGNWSDHNIPTLITDVVIPAGCPNYPVVDEVAVGNSLYVMDGGSLSVITGGSLTKTVNIILGMSTGASLTIFDGTVNTGTIVILDGGFLQMNAGSLNLTGDLYVGNGISGEFELNGGICSLAGNIYATFGSTTDINNGTISFSNWFRSPTQVFARGNVEISGGVINAAGSVAWGAFDFTGIMDGPAYLTIGGTYRNLATNWTMTDGTIYMTGTSGAGPHYFMSSLFGAGFKGSAYKLSIDGPGLEFRCNPVSSTSGYQVYDEFRVLGGLATTQSDPGYTSDEVLVGGKMLIGPLGAATMDVTGSSSVSGNLTIYSNSSGTGSWIDNGNSSVGGITSVQRYITPNQWHYVSPPVINALSGVFLGSYLRAWDEATYMWGPYIVPTNIPLNVAQGYELWKTGSPKTFVYTGGNLNTGDIPASVTATDRNNNGGIHWGDYEGWNLVGNPYPSAIDWNGSWPSSAIDPTVYLWDGTLGQYAEWNWYTGLGINKTDGTIPADQGFFVKANSFNPTLTIPQSERFHSTQAFYKSSGQQLIPAVLLGDDQPDVLDYRSRGDVAIKVNRPAPQASFETVTPATPDETGLKGGQFTPNMLKLEVTGNGYTDETIVFFDINATEDFDYLYDAFKFTGISAAPQLGSYISTEKMSMNCFPPVAGVRVVPLSYSVGADGTYTLSALTINTFDDEYTIWLEDINTGIFTNLRSQPVVQFTGKTIDPPDRFRLHFSVEDMPGQDLVKSGSLSEEMHVYSYEGSIYIKSGSSNGEVMVFNMLGQEVTRGRIEAPITVMNIPSGQGYYIVKVNGDGVSETHKVMLW
ncbi:MAG: T9SS type A sorting domain-containing protein [Bacteroidales bacterium]|nr:T9SS type A sorting domain-containing protein [Bacteroidales bacterium]